MRRREVRSIIVIVILVISVSFLVSSCGYREADLVLRQEMHFYIDETGDAEARAVIRFQGRLFTRMKEGISISQLKQSSIEELISSLAEYGIEVQDPRCETLGTGSS